MAATRRTKAQICGHVAVEVDGRRVERRFPGRQGRLLFVYLAAHRLRSVERDELLRILWGEDPPTEADGALRVLLSKLRRVLGPDTLPAGGGD